MILTYSKVKSLYNKTIRKVAKINPKNIVRTTENIIQSPKTANSKGEASIPIEVINEMKQYQKE